MVSPWSKAVGRFKLIPYITLYKRSVCNEEKTGSQYRIRRTSLSYQARQQVGFDGSNGGTVLERVPLPPPRLLPSARAYKHTANTVR